MKIFLTMNPFHLATMTPFGREKMEFNHIGTIINLSHLKKRCNLRNLATNWMSDVALILL
jgi:hypothetical protein